MKWHAMPCTKYNEHREQWASLNKDTMNLAFFEPEFVEPLIEDFLDGDELLVLAFEGELLQVAGIFKNHGKGRWATAMPSQCPLGLFLHREPMVDEQLLKQLSAQLPGKVAMLDLLQTDTKFTQFSKSNALEKMPYITSGNRPITDDFSEYFQSLGKNMRQNYNKVINRAKRSEDQLSFKKVSSPEEVQQAIVKYGEIESMGWKGEEGTAISPDNTQGKFYQSALTDLAKKNQACCWYYLINDEIVAVDLCIQKDNGLIILKTTYNETFNKQSPALMLKIEMLKYYSENKVEEGIENIEFYGKAMEWHKRLDSQLREIQHVSYYPNAIAKMAIKLIKKITT